MCPNIEIMLCPFGTPFTVTFSFLGTSDKLCIYRLLCSNHYFNIMIDTALCLHNPVAAL